MLVPFFARRVQPQVDQSLKVLPRRYARGRRTAEQNRCDRIGWAQLRLAVLHLFKGSKAAKTNMILESLHGWQKV